MVSHLYSVTEPAIAIRCAEACTHIQGLSTYVACIYELCLESIQAHTLKSRDLYWRSYKTQETLCIWQWCLSPLQSRHLGSHTVLPITISCLLYFPESRQQSEICSLSKVILVLGKAWNHRAPSPGYSGAKAPGWFNVSQKNSAGDVMHEWACCRNEAANHGLPIAVAFWIIWIDSAEFKLNAKFDANLLLYSLSQFKCNSHTVHLLTQWCLLPPLTSPNDGELIVHACEFQSTLLGCQVT